MDLTKIKLTVTRKELMDKVALYDIRKEGIESNQNLPVEKVMCEILHRIVSGKRGDRK